MSQQKRSVGCMIDIDGVVWHGGVPFDNTKKALQLLHEHQIPYVFVTNGTSSPTNVADKISNLCEVTVESEQVIAAQTPCINLTHYHNKRVLLCCQDYGIPLAKELGFNNFMTLPELIEIFPDLDYIKTEKRRMKYDRNELDKKQENFQPIEAVLLLGEPIAWESALQLIIDVLMTNGDPRSYPPKNTSDKFSSMPNPHIPVIACNHDLTFKGVAKMPRFSHGAFLECLEHLYQRITKHELKYEKLVGKPHIPTYEYALQSIEKENNGEPFDKFFIIGDNPDVDIKGANIFKHYLQNRQGKNKVTEVESILVCTGVYDPTHKVDEQLEVIEKEKVLKVHSIDNTKHEQSSINDINFNDDKASAKPDIILNDILDATYHILKSINC